jgi:hypothetical protein
VEKIELKNKTVDPKYFKKKNRSDSVSSSSSSSSDDSDTDKEKKMEGTAELSMIGLKQKDKRVRKKTGEDLDTKMKLIPVQTAGKTYTRFNKVIKCKEYLAYGGDNGTMNFDPRYFTVDEARSPLFENKKVLTLRTVCWMNPHAILENVPIPEGKQNRVTAFLCHAYKPYCYVHGNFNIKMVV